VKLLKRLAWFAGAVVIVVVAWRAFDTYQPAPVVETDLPAMPVLTRNLQRVDRIQIVRRGVTLNLERRGQIWGLAQNGGYPVKPAMAERLLDQLLALRLSHPSTPDRAELRVDEPREAGAKLTGIRVSATDGAGLGALIVADHDPADPHFPAHQLGDPRDWQASGLLDAPADPMGWVDTHIIASPPPRVTGATVSRGAGSLTLDAAAATTRLAALQAMAFTDVHPAAQIQAADLGGLVFALADGGALTVNMGLQAEQVWLELTATTPGVITAAPGAWAFRYPAAVASLLQPPA
jgi:hypothetical protein